MSYDFNYNRHNSIGGNWHLPPPQGFNGPGSESPKDGPSGSQGAPGFRNPWFLANPATGLSLPGSLSQLPTKGPQIPLLQHQNKRMSFANQLPTTYEHDAQRQAQTAPFLHPPTRADNPFNQYYTGQDVQLAGPADRRMLAAVKSVSLFKYQRHGQISISSTHSRMLSWPRSRCWPQA